MYDNRIWQCDGMSLLDYKRLLGFKTGIRSLKTVASVLGSPSWIPLREPAATSWGQWGSPWTACLQEQRFSAKSYWGAMACQWCVSAWKPVLFKMAIELQLSKRPWVRTTLLGCSWISDPLKLRDVNIHCFKWLSLGVICYIAICHLIYFLSS